MDNENISGLDDVLRRLAEAQRYFDNDVPVVIGVEAVNHFKESFQNEGFTDSSLKKWDSRKTKRVNGTNAQKILSKSGELGDSIDYRIEGDTVVIYSDKPYAQIHNEGGTIAVTDKMRAFFWQQYYVAVDATGNKEDALAQQFKFMALANSITIQQRQFMGDSQALTEKISNKIVRDLTHILKG
jgi:phage gpG-like protein